MSEHDELRKLAEELKARRVVVTSDYIEGRIEECHDIVTRLDAILSPDPPATDEERLETYWVDEADGLLADLRDYDEKYTKGERIAMITGYARRYAASLLRPSPASENESFEAALDAYMQLNPSSDPATLMQGFSAGWVAHCSPASEQLREAAEAYRDLATCYRLGKRPSEALFTRLEKADIALTRPPQEEKPALKDRIHEAFSIGPEEMFHSP